MAKLMHGDVRLVVTRLPKDVRKLMEGKGIILAGGFIRSTIAGEKVSDIDLFGKSKDQMEASALSLKNDRENARYFSSKNAFTVLSGTRYPIQFIHRWVFESPKDCMDSFDFTVAQSAIWFADGIWQSICHDNFYSDLAAKRLAYGSPSRNEDAGGSLLRVRKFLARGYNIQAPSFAAVIARLCMAVRWDEINDEAEAAFIITGLLREVDQLIAVDGFDIVDEHEILN